MRGGGSNRDKNNYVSPERKGDACVTRWGPKYKKKNRYVICAQVL